MSTSLKHANKAYLLAITLMISSPAVADDYRHWTAQRLLQAAWTALLIAEVALAMIPPFLLPSSSFSPLPPSLSFLPRSCLLSSPPLLVARHRRDIPLSSGSAPRTWSPARRRVSAVQFQRHLRCTYDRLRHPAHCARAGAAGGRIGGRAALSRSLGVGRRARGGPGVPRAGRRRCRFAALKQIKLVASEMK